MDVHNQHQLIDQRLQALRLIALLLAGSIVAYVVAAWASLRWVVFKPLAALPQAANLGIGIAAAGIILAGYVAGRRTRDAAASSGVGSGGHSDGERLNNLLHRYTLAFVVGAVGRETAAMIGLVLALLNADVTPALVLGGIALGSTVIHWPRRGAMEDWLSQQPRRG